MKNNPPRLTKCNAHETLEKQLTISVKELLTIAFICILFLLLAFTLKGPTYGVL